MVTINTRSVEDAVFLLLQCRRCDGDCTRSVEDAVFLLLQCRLCDGDYMYTFGGRCLFSFFVSVALCPQRPGGLLATRNLGHLFHTAPERWYLFLLHCCFTSTGTVRTSRDGSPGHPPPLYHSYRALGHFPGRFIWYSSAYDHRLSGMPSDNRDWTRKLHIRIGSLNVVCLHFHFHL